MKEIDAYQAKQIAEGVHETELNNILNDIVKEAERGNTVLNIHKPLQNLTINQLEQKGFEIIEHSGIAIQKEGLFYTIKWD